MAADRPKQYLQLGGKAVLLRVLERLLRFHRIERVMLGLAANDSWWAGIDTPCDHRLSTFTGGTERALTVLAGIEALQSRFAALDDDWVLVHDAVRPCVPPDDIAHLIDTCVEQAHGGLLGCELVDTLKRVSDEHRVMQTVDRRNYWRALTPQLFPLGLLRHSLSSEPVRESALSTHGIDGEEKRYFTDEAEAMENSGYQPLVVEGDPRNIKITRPADLALAEFYLEQEDADR